MHFRFNLTLETLCGAWASDTPPPLLVATVGVEASGTDEALSRAREAVGVMLDEDVSTNGEAAEVMLAKVTRKDLLKLDARRPVSVDGPAKAEVLGGPKPLMPGPSDGKGDGSSPSLAELKKDVE